MMYSQTQIKFTLKFISMYFLCPCFFAYLICANKKIWRHRCSSL